MSNKPFLSISDQIALFELYNKIDEGIRINWDELSTAINGAAKRIVHYNTGINRITDVQPPSTVPPHSKLSDAFIVAENVSIYQYHNGQKIATINHLYPNKDNGIAKERQRILALRGQHTSFFVPFYIRNIYCSKTFEFVINDVALR